MRREAAYGIAADKLLTAGRELHSIWRTSVRAWMWPVVIDGTIVVALLAVLAAKRANAPTGYPWTLAGLCSAASVAFNVAHVPDRPVAQLVFAMAPVALVLTTHLLMQQASWRHQRPPIVGHQAGIGRPQPDTGAAMGGQQPAMLDLMAGAGSRAGA